MVHMAKEYSGSSLLLGFSLDNFSPRHWLLLFFLFQLIFWTLGPWAIRFNLMYDTLESLVWGNLWQWGYDKHPPFTAWVTAIFGNMANAPDFPIYLLAQLCIVLTFYSVWRLAREYLDQRSSVLSVYMLTGILFYSNRVERVTPDTMQSPIWGALVLFTYYALTRKSPGYWLLTGLLAGLAFLTKYQVAVLFASLGMLFVFTEEGRASLKTTGPWLALLTALLVSSPHIVWLLNNNFGGFGYLDQNYLNNPDIGNGSWLDHVYPPFEFIFSIAGSLIPLLIVIWPLFRTPRNSATEGKQATISSFQKQFLFAIALGPTLWTLVMGAISGEELVPRWATPYFAWLPLFLLVIFNRKVDNRIFKKIVIRCLILALSLWSLRLGYLYYKPYISDDYWKADEYIPARETMAMAEKLWNEQILSPLPYLGGLHYHIMGLSAYADQGSIPFSGLNPAQSLWMNESDFRKSGGIIVIEEKTRNTQEVLKRLNNNYPEAIYLGSHHFRPRIPDNIINAQPSIVQFYIYKPEIMRLSERKTTRK